jgi:hypothetical protein
MAWVARQLLKLFPNNKPAPPAQPPASGPSTSSSLDVFQ